MSLVQVKLGLVEKYKRLATEAGSRSKRKKYNSRFRKHLANLRLIATEYDLYRSKEIEPQKFVIYPGLSDALRGGDTLHGFRSGGGLRVVSLKNNSGYGEYPTVETALRYAEEDYQVGGRKYKEFYGPVVDHYLTGSSNPSSEFDKWLLAGYSFNITFDSDRFVFNGKYFHQVTVPKEVRNRVVATQQTERWTNEQGILFNIEPFTFPSGAKGNSMTLLDNPTEYDPLFQERKHTETAATLEDLFHNFVGVEVLTTQKQASRMR